ncbi:Type I restriction enzyme specificity protein MG438 [Lacticaseibacillus paracasei]|uniref:restriction endonuclease subunit S n=1 Tax=Lacticaseibacillus paracasei TaxID=1597 RepID=UPI000FF48113|nr:restriction endonuclease subunit S [Lacticaseibacillus paracasei]RNE25108.1 Type I restriction enzyme specificity protein MG438 [Lacticaseibacillus paracasei]
MKDNQAKYPQLRFKGFTDPWEERKLGDLGSVAMNKRIFKEQTSDVGDIPFYKIGTFGGTPDAFISRDIFEEYKSKYQYPEVGDILISASGSIGRTVVYRGDDEYFQDSNIVWLKHDQQLDNSFLKQFYSIVKWQGLEGSTIKRLYNKNILETKITLPSPEEQAQLGSFFKQLDNTIALHQRKLDLLKEQKKGYLQKMFPKNGAKVPELRFLGFADDWEERKLENIAQINKGIQRGKQEISSVRNELNPYPVYNGGKKASGYTDECNRENSVMVSEGGASAGYVNYYSGKYWSGGHNFTISNDTKHDTFFLLYVLQKSQEKLYKLQVGTGLPNIQLKSIKDFPIYSTSNTEQQKIGSFFKELDDTIALHQRKLEKLQELKKGYLQKMFC